jgi:hypothetical protein
LRPTKQPSLQPSLKPTTSPTNKEFRRKQIYMSCQSSKDGGKNASCVWKNDGPTI